MSNTTFKSVKSVDEHFSDLNVSGNAVVHERLYVKDLVATNVLNVPAGKQIVPKEFDITLNGTTATSSNVVVDTANNVNIIAAEITHNGSVTVSTSTVNVGTAAASATNIFNGAPAGTHRVSSAYSQILGSSGSASPLQLSANSSLYLVGANGASGNTVVKLTVYYYV